MTDKMRFGERRFCVVIRFRSNSIHDKTMFVVATSVLRAKELAQQEFAASELGHFPITNAFGWPVKEEG